MCGYYRFFLSILKSIVKKYNMGKNKKDNQEEDDKQSQNDVSENTSDLETSDEETNDDKKSSNDAEQSTSDNEQSSNDEENDNIDQTGLAENVAAYIKLDNMIRQKKDEIKELCEKQQEYGNDIQEYLTKVNKTKIETKDGDIVLKQTQTKSPLKEELIEKAIVKKFQDTKKISESGVKIAHDIIEEVNQLRGVSVKNRIRRMKAKTPSKSKKSK